MPVSLKTIDPIKEQEQQQEFIVPTEEQVLKSFVKMQANIFDITALKRFYDTGQKEPLDTTGWCLPILCTLLTKQLQLKITNEGFRVKIKKLERYGFVKKIPRTNPSVYEPNVEMKYVVRKCIVLWLLRRGYRSL